jgi:hypothetical protein
MVNDVPDARALYKDEVDSAKQFVNTLPVGTHNITTDTVAAGYNRKNQNWNWFYAVGGYSAWIKGAAKVEQDKSGKRKFRRLSGNPEKSICNARSWKIKR